LQLQLFLTLLLLLNPPSVATGILNLKMDKKANCLRCSAAPRLRNGLPRQEVAQAPEVSMPQASFLLSHFELQNAGASARVRLAFFWLPLLGEAKKA